jgi:cyclic-di-GMP phosphodiesterase TipF (flagellum assembly factor)
MGSGMVRISAIFIALCMVLIAGSLGFVVYLRFGLTGAESALVALGALTALAVYNTIAARTRDRSEVSNQIANLGRGSGDMARQLAEFGRRLNAMEGKVESVLDRALATAQPLAAEIEELSTLVKQLAESVAQHDAVLGSERKRDAATSAEAFAVAPLGPAAVAGGPDATIAAPIERKIAAFAGLDREGIIAAIGSAIEASRIDLYLQPIVTLPQRKVRYYEAMSRLKVESGELVPAGDFLSYAEAGSLVPKLDNLSVLRCVQVARRLLLKNRDIGLFCNVAGATLTDFGFPQFLEFVDANRAIAHALVFEFTQSAVRAMGPIEHESLAALAERGFRFSMDNLTDLRVEARELNERGFRFIKVPATLLLNRVGAASTDIHPADFSDLLGRFGIDLIAERIESEGTVVDLLDYDVRFGQGYLFSPPRPVRAEALQGLAADAAKDSAKTDPVKNGAAKPDAPGPTRIGSLAQLARAGSGRS